MRQDYYNFEIIIVDDGSTDNTCSKLIEHFNLHQMELVQVYDSIECKDVVKTWRVVTGGIHLYLIKKKNGGKGDALNAGINYSHGEYVVCIDADCIVFRNMLSCLTEIIRNQRDIIAVGGMVLPVFGISNKISRSCSWLIDALQSFQELEYGIAFTIARPIFNRMETTMIISGAIGLFKRDLVVKLGGYSVDTVGEDMELVMRIRQYAATSKTPLKISYTRTAVCYAQLPWRTRDLIKQRIRWTVGLSDVLWRYRDMAISEEYNFYEKITFWYYILIEKFSPHIEFIGLLVCLFLKISKVAITLMVLTVIVQLTLACIGSYKSLISSIKSSKSRLKGFGKITLLVLSFVTIYHAFHSIVRLISVPYNKIKRCKSKSANAAWNSPKRM